MLWYADPMMTRRYKPIFIALLSMLLLAVSFFSMNFLPKVASAVVVSPCHQVQTSSTGSASCANATAAKYLSLPGFDAVADTARLLFAISLIVSTLLSLIWAERLLRPPKVLSL